jgi:acetylornithine deacetylase/succinyl-diaminopimelate desuccinylase-like protein
MKVKLTAVLIITLIATSLAITTASSKTSKNPVAAKAPTAPTASTTTPLPQDPTGTIDGATQPDRIPDRVAYSLLFRFLSGRNTEDEKNRARAYVRMIFGCRDCGSQKETPEQKAAAQVEVEALFSIASDFEKHVGALDRQAREIKGQSGAKLDKESRIKLGQLKAQKDTFVDSLMASLPNRLGASGVAKLRRFIKEEFKQKVKIGPAPTQRKQVAQTGTSA